MPTEPINTIPLQQFIQQVKAADSSKAKDVRLDIATAKALAFTLGIVMSRMQGDLEKLVSENNNSSSNNDEVITITMDGGTGWK
jgi:hypothetical protein